MIVADRLRALRTEKDLSQGDIEKRTGLLRCYISRVENGHTVPSIETLEKMARALEVPMYQLFYEGGEPPKAPAFALKLGSGEEEWGMSGKGGEYFRRLRTLLARMGDEDRKLLFYLATRMARKK
jgi:transcriptional regulator with XRE-family HTH domain